jgi:hypothetical protein
MTTKVTETVTVTVTETSNTPAVETKTARVYRRNLIRAEFNRTIPNIAANGTKAFRKHLLAFVMEVGGAKNSGPAEYNLAMQEAIAAGLIRKEKRGVLVAVGALAVNSELPAASSEPVTEPVLPGKTAAKKRGKKVVAETATSAAM